MYDIREKERLIFVNLNEFNETYISLEKLTHIMRTYKPLFKSYSRKYEMLISV